MERLITDSVIVAFEAFHSMYDQYSINGGIMIKLDMTKMYG